MMFAQQNIEHHFPVPKNIDLLMICNMEIHLMNILLDH